MIITITDKLSTLSGIAMIDSKFKTLVDRGVYREVYNQIELPYYLLETGEPNKRELAKYLVGTATAFIFPFHGSLVGKFKTKEFIILHLQLKDPEIKDMFLQIPILRKSYYHATIFSIVTMVKMPIPETIIGIDPSLKFIPYSPLKRKKGMSVRKVFKHKINWNTLLDSLNNDRDLKNMIGSLPSLEYAGFLKAEIKKNKPPGYVRFIPYKGWTIIELVVAPIHKVSDEIGEESFNISASLNIFKRILYHLKLYGTKRGEIGIIPMGTSNQHSVLWAIRRIEEFSAGNPPRKHYSQATLKDFEKEKLNEFEAENNSMTKRIFKNKRISYTSFGVSLILILLYIINLFTNLFASFIIWIILLSGLIITFASVIGVYLLGKNKELKKRISENLIVINYLKTSIRV